MRPRRPRRPKLPPILLACVAGGLLPAAALSAQERVPERETTFVLDTMDITVGSRLSSGLPVSTRAVEVIGREEIRATPARTVQELLRWATGVEYLPRSPAQADLSIRGAGFEQVLVLVNGVRVSDRQTGHFDLNVTVPLDQVERVEVLRGPGSAVYGADAVGGVVNIVTRETGPAWSGRLEGGSFGTAGLSLSGGASRPAAAGGGRGFELRGGGELSRSDGHRPGTDHEMLLARLEAGAPLAGGRVTTELGFAHRGFGAEDFYGPFPAWEETTALTAAARWAPGAGPGVRLEPRLSLRRHDDDFILRRDDPTFYRNLHTTWQVGGEVVGRHDRAGPLAVAFGGEAYVDLLESTALGDRSESRGAAFVEGALARGVTSATLGVRADAHETFGFFLSPSVSGAWAAGPTLRLRVSAGRAYRGPTWTERYYVDPANVGNADLGTERSWTVEGGADLAPGDGVRLSATLFRRSSSDLIDWARPAGTQDEDGIPWETRNVERATVNGIEGEITLVETRARPLGEGLGARLSVGGSLLSLATRQEPGFESKYALRPLVQQLHVTLARPLTGRSDLSVKALRGRRGGEDPFHQVDARLQLRTGRLGPLGAGTLHLDVTNLLDARHPDVIGMPVAGRALLAGFSLSQRE